MTHIGRMTAPEARTAFSQAKIGILPIGATEQHGAHLELRTDTRVAETIAEHIQNALGAVAVLFPAIPVGLSEHHMSFPGTLTLRPATLRAILLDLAESAAEHGLTRLVIVNGHGGNIDAIRLASREALRDYGVRVAHVMWATVGREEVARIAAGEHVHNHACQVETSLALALDDSLVRTDALGDPGRVREPMPLVDPPKSLIDLPYRFEEISPDGSLGHPSQSSIADGQSLLDQVLRRAIKFCEEFASSPDGA